MKLLYDIAISAFGTSIGIASMLGNEKAKKWVEGRKGQFALLQEKMSSVSQPLVWIHASSLGEFEMGKPLVKEIQEEGKCQVLVSFFSPSGYEYVDEQKEGFIKCYLPLDKKKYARKFLEIVQAEKAIFIKNDIWINYLNELKERKIDSFLVSSDFRKDQIFFKSYGSIFKRTLQSFKKIFVQNEDARTLLLEHGITAVEVSGDMRMDQTFSTTREKVEVPEMRLLNKDRLTLILGSSWPEEEAMIKAYVSKNEAQLNLIIAPHDVSEKHLSEIQKQFPNAKRLSQTDPTENHSANQIIVDGIGLLKHLYAYADIAFIGGAWGKGLHNILEAAAFGLPVVFGPGIKKFKEAQELVKRGGAVSVANQEELNKTLNQLVKDNELRQKRAEISLNFVKENLGATEISYKGIFANS